MLIRTTLLSTTVMGAVMLAAPVYAQTADAPAAATEEQGEQVADIIVTARKVDESIQTTPVAVTAITSAALETKQIEQLSDLSRAAPNFNVIAGGTGGALVGQFALRGQTQTNAASSNDSPVGLYVDGVYYARMQANNGGTLDMASAQVLRGPQGTLFGRNTTGGAVLLTSNAPTDRLEGSLKVGTGNYGLLNVEGVANIPLSDEVSTRIAGSYETRDGYVFNANTNKRVGDLNHYFLRGSIKWAPTDKPFTVRLIGDMTRYSDNGTPSRINAVNPAVGLGGMGAGLLALPNGFYTDYSGVTASGSQVATAFGFPAGFGASGNSEIDTPHNKIDSNGASLQVDLELGDMTLKSISAYRDSNARNSWDLDGTPVNGIAFASQYTQKQVSQEFNLSGSIGNLEWLTGLFYFREHGVERSDAWQFAAFSRDLTDWNSRSIGAFAQGTYKFTDALRFTGGLRYTWDRRYGDLHGVYGGTQPDFSDALCGAGATFNLPAATNACSEVRVGKFSYPAWVASLDYQVTDNFFAYLKTSGAAMAGGVNFRYAPAANRQFAPEKVRDVEAGFKADMLDRRVRINGAFFYLWRYGLQTNVNPFIAPRGTTQYQINTGDAHQYGVELEATVVPWQGMELNGSFAYLKAKYVAGSYIVVDPVSSAVVNHSNDPVVQAPKYNWSIGATQKVPVAGLGDLSLHADYSYISTYYQYADSTVSAAALAAGAIKGHGLLNGRAAFTLDNPNIEFAVWGRNLAGKKYIASVFAGLYGPLGISTGNPGAPRTYGASATFRW